MKRILLLSLSILLLSCQSDDIQIPEFALETADEFGQDVYDVYSTILENYSNTQVVIKQETTSRTPAESTFELFFNLEKMSNMEATLFANYEDANGSTALLDENIEIASKQVHLISDDEHSYFFERQNTNKAWSLFQTKYPQSGAWFFSLNKIGFNENRTQAIVGVESYWYMESPDGPTLNSGTLHYLEKKDGVWQSVGSSVYAL